jgi:FAD/FMN-containing dehydrogenase
MLNHNEKLNIIIDRVRVLNKYKQKAYIYHGSTNTTRTVNFTRDNIIDLSEFTEILEINTKEKYVVCEPNVPMDKLVDATLAQGVTPPVVMDFPGITVGGGISGGAGESSSFKYGLFNHTVLECEVVLGNGDCISVSREKNADLFWGLASTLGSLAIITKIKLRLIEAKKYVKLNYLTVYSFKELVDKTAELAKSGSIDFLDGIMFKKDSGVVISGMYTDEVELKNIITFSNSWDEWFYLHAQKQAGKQTAEVDYLLSKEYFFRYDRGAFWMGWYYFLLFKIPFNSFTRRIYNRWMNTRELYKALHAGNMSQRYFIQDISTSVEKVKDLFNFLENKLNIYPLWLWPIKPTNNQDKMAQNYLNTDLVMNVGIWGSNKNIEQNFLEINRDLEKFLLDNGGRKMFYAHSYFTKEEFWKVYNKDWYENLRSKYFGIQAFPDVFTKLEVKQKYKAQIFIGFFKFMFNKNKKIK